MIDKIDCGVLDAIITLVACFSAVSLSIFALIVAMEIRKNLK